MHPLLYFKKFIYVVTSKKIKFWFIKQIKSVFQGFETQTRPYDPAGLTGNRPLKRFF